MAPPLTIAYFGLPLAALLLDADGHDVRCAVLSPVDHPGRRRLLRRLGPARVLDVLELGDDYEAAVEAALAETEAELLVSWFWTRRLPARWLSRFSAGAVGAHPSLLPRHRGPNPYFWAIDSGDEETGVCVFRLTAEYDAGEVLDRVSLPIGTRNAWQLARALDRPSLRLLRRTTRAFAEGRPPSGAPQDDRFATWAPEPDGAALRVDWSWPTSRILRRVRALSPVPGLALSVRGVRFFVTAAEATPDCPLALRPGEAAVLGERLVIRTGDSAIAVSRGVLNAEDEESAASEELNAEQLARLVAARGEVLECLDLEAKE